MALAYLRLDGVNGPQVGFDADIGTNAFYKLKIGAGKTNVGGIDVLEEPSFETPLLKSPPYNPFHSVFSVEIPLDKFSKQNKYVQLTSFKDQQKKSPAVSKVIQVYPSLNALYEDLPEIPSAYTLSHMSNYPPISAPHCRAVSFSFEEARYSTPMFWDELLNAAKLLSPSIGALTSLLGSSGGQSANNEGFVQAVQAILDTLKKEQGGANTPAKTENKATPAETAKPAPTPENAVSKPQSLKRDYFSSQRSVFREFPNGKFSTQKIVGIDDAIIGGILASAAPSLLSGLPQLLTQSPQLLQVLADSPIKLLSVLNEMINKQGQLQLQKKQADQLHIEHLLTESGKNFLLWQTLLRSAAGNPSPENQVVKQSSLFSITRTPAKSASKIVLQKDNPITVNGKPKFVYAAKSTMKLLAHLSIAENSAKNSPVRAIVVVCIKDIVSKKYLLEKTYKLKDVAANSIQEFEIPSDEVQILPRNQDLLVSVSFRYNINGKTTQEGIPDTHVIFLSNEFFYKGIGSKIGNNIPLSDRNKYRIYWNKIWEGGTKTKKRWELNLSSKYYIYYRYDQTSNGRIETKILQSPQEESERELVIEGKLKSGLEISPVELNNLLSLTGLGNPLSEDKLQAFQTEELSKDFNTEAIASLEMKGKTEETGSIWTYPEIALYEFLLNKIDKTDANGQVIAIQEEKVIFPKPCTIHFVGEKTTTNHV